ncbi:MAG: methyltransferase domain-containing protein [Acidobacteriota bacterium]|nr:methyltransferase domain-containing protein [Acidobacteriota bacterium]
MIPDAKGLWLNLGSSGRITPGFVHLDREAMPGVQVHDIRLGLPYFVGAAEVVVMSHVLEHLHPFWEAPAVLREVHRVLLPGGVFRLAVPDLAKLSSAYQGGEDQITDALAKTQSELREYIGTSYADLPAALKFSVIAFGDNSGSSAYDGHRVIFDAESLKWILERAGFKDFAVVGPTESRHPTLLTRYRDVEAAEEIVVEVSR